MTPAAWPERRSAAPRSRFRECRTSPLSRIFPQRSGRCRCLRSPAERLWPLFHSAAKKNTRAKRFNRKGPKNRKIILRPESTQVFCTLSQGPVRLCRLCCYLMQSQSAMRWIRCHKNNWGIWTDCKMVRRPSLYFQDVLLRTAFIRLNQTDFRLKWNLVGLGTSMCTKQIVITKVWPSNHKELHTCIARKTEKGVLHSYCTRSSIIVFKNINSISSLKVLKLSSL